VVPRTSWPHIVLGAVGAAVSGYAVHVHYLAKAHADTGCGFSNTINCETVMSSRWGELFGIPLGYFGILYFVIVILAAVVGKINKPSLRTFALTNLLLAGVGFLVSLALTYISLHYIHAECPVCLTIHTTTLLLLLVSLSAWRRARLARSTTPTS
jgi:uncharacterized membrane protein